MKRAAIGALCASRLPSLMVPLTSGIGSILMLHRVRPSQRRDFAPNACLEITPVFLERLIARLRKNDIDIVSLDDAVERLRSGGGGRRFACFTLDDGYVDNDVHARPIFERLNVPYTIYLTTGLPDRTAIFWWLVLEEQIGRRDRLDIQVKGERETFETATHEQKTQVYDHIYKHFRLLPAHDCMEASKRLCDDLEVDPAELCAREGLSWDAVGRIARSDLGHIEAHTTAHLVMSLQTRAAAIADIEAGIERIDAQTGVRPRHFAYPFGDQGAAGPRDYEILDEMPIASATTTIDGVLKAHHSTQMSSLPRINVNGLYQSDGYLDMVCCGTSPLLARAG
ncbi:MAG: polysaccharide deacetylase family protein [Alphaproteobacteria bacterium]